MKRHFAATFLVCVLFVIALLAVPIEQLSWLSMMPGDLGDARLNNYFLEHIYQFLRGHSPSLVHLRFYYPFPYVLGFGDNLFGSSPAYLLPRVLTGQPDTAFQFWYLLGYLANYIAAYYALRRLRTSTVASSVGALIFAFALPVTAHSGHSQLHYRFGVPMATVLFIEFLKRRDWRHFVAAAGWVVWQLYCSIYIGFFLVSMLFTMFGIFLTTSYGSERADTFAGVRGLYASWRSLPSRTRLRIIAGLTGLILATGILFYPYLQVSIQYKFSRSWDEIATMMPRLHSYFVSDLSWLWSSKSKVFDNLPMRHEHQMFVGAVPLVLAIWGILVGCKRSDDSEFVLLGGSLVVLILVTLSVGGLSAWYLLAKLPLASAIRAMTRIILVFLFPIAYFSATSVDRLREMHHWGNRFLFVVLIPLLLFEVSATSANVSSKSEWRQRLQSKEKMVPAKLHPDSILFFAQSEGTFFAIDELDSMWIALKRGVPTLNGYSGLLPPGYQRDYGSDCSEALRRVQAYQQFEVRAADAASGCSLLQRIVLIGFSRCDPARMTELPQLTRFPRAYTREEFRSLSLHYAGRSKQQGQWYARIRIVNSGEQAISAASATENPVRVSWRFRDAVGKPLSGWDTRMDLPRDIPQHGSLDLMVPVESSHCKNGRSVEFSLVQEGLFWGHDIGIAPLTIGWKPES